MRYFLEIAYLGRRYSGFQIQENALTIQSETENAFATLQREKVEFTGSSRTDAGVHARQNFFHFDYAGTINPQFIYKINAILPADIVVKAVYTMPDSAHARFDAIARSYAYFIYQSKDPFLNDRAYYFPYTIDQQALHEAATAVLDYSDFTSFSKRNTQVKTFICQLTRSEWQQQGECLVYKVEGNRFLRGMVRGLVATMLLVARGRISIQQFRDILMAKDCTKADFSVPGHGLFLTSVQYPEGFLPPPSFV
jgi:tRNA pseudouridine38-40 synthase